jgi:hypothetical protein
MNDIEESYKKLLRKAIEKGEISASIDVDKTAYFFTNTQQGIMVYSKVKQDKPKLQAIVKEALKILTL